MKIIDSHVHLLEEKNFDVELWKENNIEPPKNTPIKNLINWLKEVGVIKAVIMGQDMTRIWNSSCGEKYLYEIYKKYDDFFIPLMSLEPVDKTGKLNKKAFNYLNNSFSKGFRGILLTPPYGQYHSNDRRIYPFYEIAEENNLIIQFHHGTTLFGPNILGHLKYANFLDLNDVLIDFPKLKFVIEHLGLPWTEQIFVLMVNNRNIYTDLAQLYDQKFSTAWRLVLAKEYGVLDRIMYASDYWVKFSENPQEDMKRWINYIKLDLNDICKKSNWPTFEDDEIEGILWKNASRLYGLNC